MTPGTYSRTLRTLAQREAGRTIATTDAAAEAAVERYMAATGRSADDLLKEFGTTRKVPTTPGATPKVTELGPRTGKPPGQKVKLSFESDIEGAIVMPGDKPAPSEVSLFLARVRQSGLELSPAGQRLVDEYQLGLTHYPADETLRRAIEIASEQADYAYNEAIQQSQAYRQLDRAWADNMQLSVKMGDATIPVVARRGGELVLQNGETVLVTQVDGIVDDLGRNIWSSTGEDIFRRARDVTKGLDDEITEALRRRVAGREKLFDDSWVEEMAQRTTTVADDAAEGFVTPPITTADDQFNWAFRSGMADGQRNWRKIAHGPLRTLIRGISPAIIHGGDPIGQTYLAYQRMVVENAIHNTLAFDKLRSIGVPFKVADGTIFEETTNTNLYDLIENWRQGDNFRERFSLDPDIAKMDEFVDTYQQIRLDTLRDMERMGAHVPDAWKEHDHVFRQAEKVAGIDFYDGARPSGAFGAKPGTLRQRLFESAQEGIEQEVEYATDFIAAAEFGNGSLRKFAIEEAVKARVSKLGITAGGVLRSTEKGQKLLLDLARANLNNVWGQRVRTYANNSLRSRMARPIFRQTKQGYTVPSDLLKVVDDIDAVHKQNLTGAAKRGKIKPLIQEAGRVADEYTKAQQRLRGVVDDEMSKQRLLPGRFFNDMSGKARTGSRAVRVGMAPPEIAAFGGKYFMDDDIKSLLKLFKREKHSFLETTTKITDLFRTGSTALDPGFWFIHGLGPMAADLVVKSHLKGFKASRGALGLAENLIPGQLWGRAVWQSARAFWSEKHIHSYWAAQLARYPDEMQRFAHHAGMLTHQTGGSHEFLAALEKGGIVDALAASKVPGVRQTGKLAQKAGNAFANYLDFSMWEVWKALEPLADSPQKLDELGDFIRNITGVFSPAQNGLSHYQRLMERSWILWAPSYTRAIAGLLLKGTQLNTFGGRLAFRGIAGMAAASTMLMTGALLAREMVTHGGDPFKWDWDSLSDDFKSSYWGEQLWRRWLYAVHYQLPRQSY
jgi:hypothetical protein